MKTKAPTPGNILAYFDGESVSVSGPDLSKLPKKDLTVTVTGPVQTITLEPWKAANPILTGKMYFRSRIGNEFFFSHKRTGKIDISFALDGKDVPSDLAAMKVGELCDMQFGFEQPN